MKIKTIIFDFDGVIADTIPYTLEKTLKILKEDFNLKKSDKEIILIIRTNSFKEIMRLVGLSILKLPFIVGKITKTQEELFEIIDEIKIIPGIKGLLRRLKKSNIRLVIISSNLKKNIEKFILKNNLTFFDEIIDSKIFGKTKEINDFLKNNKLKENEVIYIGDEIRDIEACKKVSIKVIGVSWGLQDAKILKKRGADFIAKKPLDILKIVTD
ncbi:MAG: HAD-superfamily hydrolase, subfamily IA, variant 1 [Candidatus Roizmanbacteria bacterium GW2011_GWC2_37_13]|uniref:HAD-superfamily hydrolase, subfamily IA, variant 1 n=1 Tax=Candidatus Roizmanbacteria bacterium GW2011_GWC2_37_13 TaxID=1618486 RepID=A0A0G0G3G7_9BACT|nr:MAG: HAD-superfamily hydrolase, subfamily IA, variant 1 [Candidatus Roizmanbacteria bacterium GW2011_GWC1_37_12]KKQ24577.1 MAG: HAD-superfamily hydrolase, subfamily IA, variant 1 [Candidatus Roizmanbacteria bacterium GW2011_GWC2_37_13]